MQKIRVQNRWMGGKEVIQNEGDHHSPTVGSPDCIGREKI